jgi:outer membrane protein assembly factor BamB
MRFFEITKSMAAALIAAWIGCGPTSGFAGDWTQFRGTDTSAVAVGEKPPTIWTNDTNIAWRADLPGRGISTPIVVGERVFLTASAGADDDRLHLLCFDAKTGKSKWVRQFWATGRTQSHPKMCNATPSPASDGERVFAFFSSNDVVCTDLDGTLLWYRGMTFDYPNASNSLGMSSSLVVADETLVVQVENDSESFTAGLDVRSGVNRWKLDRPRFANWTSPALGKLGDRTVALISSGAGVIALEPRSGNTVWDFKDGGASIPSTGVGPELAIVPSKGGVSALKLVAGESQPTVLWSSNKLSPGTSSPIVFDGRVYAVNRAGVLNCGSATSGEAVWQLRLEGPFSATPIIANGHLYIFNEGGKGQVVRLDSDKGEIVSSHDFGETILGTPSIAGNALYVRSDKHLWKIAAP